MAQLNAWDKLTGHSNAQSNPWTSDPEYQKQRYNYNQTDGGAQFEQNSLDGRKAEVEARTAPQMQGAQMQGAQLDQHAADQSRDVQMGSLAGLSAAANGAAPSAAENLARQGIDRSLRAQVSAAGTTRGGPGAAASAYRYAAQNGAQQRADMNQGIQAERANEMSTARGQLASASTAARGQDLTAATTNASLAQDTSKTNASLAQDTSKTNAGLQLQSTGQNDARAEQYEALRHQTAQDQLNADLQQQQTAAQVRMGGDQLNQQTNIHNADRNWNVFQGAVGLGQGVIGGVGKLFAGSDPGMKTPVWGSLAHLGLGGTSGAAVGSHGHGVGGGVELDQSGGISHDDLLAAGSGLGDPNMMHGMVGGGGITGGHVDTGEDGTSSMMTSDEDAKEAPQTFGQDEDRSSPTFRSWIGRSAKGAPEDGKTPDGGAITTGKEPVKEENGVLASIAGGIADAHPYGTEPEKGVAGAPKGYAAGRGGPEDDKVSWSKPKTWASNQKGVELPDSEGQAPGTDDWNRYGAGAKDAPEVDWHNGGSTAKPEAEGRPGVFEAVFGGLAGAHAYGTAAPRDTTTSDPAAKRAAYEAGFADGGGAAKGRKQDVRPKGAGAPVDPEKEELIVTAKGDPEIRDKGARYISREEVPPDTIAWDMTKDDPFIRSAASQAKGQGRAVAAGEGGVSAFATPPAAPPPASSATDRARAFARDVVRSDEKTKQGFEQVSDDTMAKAMRSMDPAVYAYKPEYAPPDQKPGEVNIGPMANAMAKDPVARTAIVRDADSGMLAIDKTKAEKVMMGSLAALQHQLDELKGDVPRADSAKKQRHRGEPAHP